MRTEHKHLNVSASWIRRKLVEYATYRVFVSRDGGPEVEYSRSATCKLKKVTHARGVSVVANGLGFNMAMEILYRWMEEANVLIMPDGTFHIKAYSTKENK